MPALHQKLRLHELGRLDAEAFRSSGKWPLCLVLDGVRSAHNLGSVLRTADAFRLEAVHICGPMPLPNSAEVSKTALGAENWVPWVRWEKISDCLASLSDHCILALEQTDKAIDLNRYSPDSGRKIALVIGHEITGVSEEALGFCEDALSIPQFGTKHSLNLSVATGIACWALLFGSGNPSGLISNSHP
jgi:tRNA G18 (ribose-2'-O)-methylase SpoU